MPRRFAVVGLHERRDGRGSHRRPIGRSAARGSSSSPAACPPRRSSWRAASGCAGCVPHQWPSQGGALRWTSARYSSAFARSSTGRFDDDGEVRQSARRPARRRLAPSPARRRRGPWGRANRAPWRRPASRRCAGAPGGPKKRDRRRGRREPAARRESPRPGRSAPARSPPAAGPRARGLAAALRAARVRSARLCSPSARAAWARTSATGDFEQVEQRVGRLGRAAGERVDDPDQVPPGDRVGLRALERGRHRRRARSCPGG